jgi:uncharacterized SAM-binding protein YcdF (DUF218 family)
MKERDVRLKRYLRLVVTTIGAAIFLYGLFGLAVSNFNLGLVMLLLVGVVLILWFNVPNKKWIKAIKTLILIGFVLLFAVIGFIIVKMTSTKTSYDDDVVVVLGCAVVGTRPSNTLRNRLEECVDYYNKNPEAVIIVSGGQGPQEDISEAEAMKLYLTNRGIPLEKIYTEDKATSTDENFKYSKVIIDELFPNGCKVCYITNDFHSYRAGMYAKKNGIEAVSCNSKTSINAIAPSYLREAVAVVHYWVFGN